MAWGASSSAQSSAVRSEVKVLLATPPEFVEATAAALELDAPGVAVVVATEPQGSSALERAAAAQRAATEAGAALAVWTEDALGGVTVRVVEHDGVRLHQTTLRDVPTESWPRFISLAAASLLDDLLNPGHRASTEEREIRIVVEHHPPTTQSAADALTSPPPASSAPAEEVPPPPARDEGRGVERAQPTNLMGREDWNFSAAPLFLFTPRADDWWSDRSYLSPQPGGGVQLAAGRYLFRQLRIDAIGSFGWIGYGHGPEISLGAQALFVSRTRVRLGFGGDLRGIIAREFDWNGSDTFWWFGYAFGGVGELAFEATRRGALVARIAIYGMQAGDLSNRDLAFGLNFSVGLEWQ